MNKKKLASLHKATTIMAGELTPQKVSDAALEIVRGWGSLPQIASELVISLDPNAEPADVLQAGHRMRFANRLASCEDVFASFYYLVYQA